MKQDGLADVLPIALLVHHVDVW